jgi:spore coat protein CotH
MRFRRAQPVIVGVGLILLVLVLALGDMRIFAFTSSEQSASEAEAIVNIPGTVDLFDDSVVHEVEISFAAAEYDNLIATYQDEGEKAYIQASVTIDGTTISPVGLRLKGNSTLMGLRRDGPFGGGQRGFMPPAECVPSALRDMMPAATPAVAGTPEAGGTPEEGASPVPGATPVAGEMTESGGGQGGPGGPGGFGANLDAEDPSTLPWLISIDEYVDGQRYQGYADIAVRPVMLTEANLNESLSLKLVGAADEATQLAAYSSVSWNDSEPALRLLLEVPGEAFAERNFGGNGVLYKSLSTGGFDYLGDDPTLLSTAFDQETARHHQDLKPVIELMKWNAEASDKEFAAELDQHVEIVSLARYIALQELLDNFDDMAGPGKNYYLWYDLGTKRFTIVNWDLNLALSSMGGGPGGRGFSALEDVDFSAMQACIARVRGEEAGDTADDGRGGPGGRGGMRMGHPIKDRFLVAPEFQALYAREYANVYNALFDGDSASQELTRLAGVVARSGLVEPEKLATGAADLQKKLGEQSAMGPVPLAKPVAGKATPGASPVAATPVTGEDESPA